MHSLLKKIFTGTTNDAIHKILETQSKKGFCIIDYLYFAQIEGKKLFDTPTKAKNINSDQFKHALLPDYKNIKISTIRSAYKHAIFNADLVLPDGIALQIFYFLGFRKRLHNLNGTDFCPAFLAYTHQHHKLNLLLYGASPDLLKQARAYLEKQGYHVGYAQDGYSNLDWQQVEKNLYPEAVNVLLVARSHITYPIQEIRSEANKDMIQKCKLIVFNQGGTFDFRAGKQKRAPALIRSLKLEWLWRVITDPQRNIKKIRYTLFFFKYIFYYLLLKKE